MAGPDISDPRPSMCTCVGGVPYPRCPIHGGILDRDPPETSPRPIEFNLNEFIKRFGPPSTERLTWAPEEKDEVPQELTPEEQIRTWALDAASRVFAGSGVGVERGVIRMAREFERYLLGESDAESPPDP